MSRRSTTTVPRRIAAATLALASALGLGLLAAAPAVAASDPAVLALSLETPAAEGTDILVTGSCPAGTLGARAFDPAANVSVLLWPDGTADLSIENYNWG